MICEGLVADWSETRGWLQFLIVVGTATLGLLTFIRAARQNRLSNAIKLVERFENRFRGHDYDQFRRLVESSYVGAGAELGKFVGASGEEFEFSDLFTEGSMDGLASTRILQELEIICGEWLKRTVSRKFIYGNLGQLLEFYNMHLKADPEMEKIYQRSWINLFSVMRENSKYQEQWTYRLLAVAEDADVVYGGDPLSDDNATLLYDGRDQERWKI